MEARTFSSERDGQGVVWVMDPDGSHLRSLPQLHGAEAPIDWLPS